MSSKFRDMRIHRFYIEKIEVVNEQILLEDKELLNQILNVFRMEVGDRFSVFNTKEFLVEIAEANKKQITCTVVEEKEVLKHEKALTLAFSMIKKENMELILQKCTEIGATRFVPIISERTIKTGWNFDRMQKIVIEATEQSGWGEVPKVEAEPKKLETFLEENKNILVLDFDGEKIEGRKSFAFSPLTILIGPEGGFSEDEREKFKTHNLKTISLGKNVLRAETAAIAISSLLLL